MKQLMKKYCSPVDTTLNLGRKIFQDKNQNHIEKVEIPQIISEIIWHATFVNQLITKHQNAQIKIVYSHDTYNILHFVSIKFKF